MCVIGVIGVINKICGIEAFKADGTIHVIDEDELDVINVINASGAPRASGQTHTPDGIGRIHGIKGTDGIDTTGCDNTSEPSVRRAGLDEISRSRRAKGAPGGARGRTVPALRRGGNRDLNARKAHKGTVRRVMTRGVGSCL